MSGTFESLQWNACVHRLDIGLYSYSKEFFENGVRTHVNSKGQIPFTSSSEEDRTHDTSSRRTVAQHTSDLSYSSTATKRSNQLSTAAKRSNQFFLDEWF